MKIQPLKPGDTIGVMAPSSYVEKEDIERSKALLEQRGYKVALHDQTFFRHHQSAGSAQEKLSALHDLYADKTIDALWAAGGGNRALYMLDGLDYGLISKNPKPLIGFSDVTALLNSIYANTGIEGVHAQVFKNLHSADDLDAILAVLSGAETIMPLSQAGILNPGKAEGTLVGGCLSLFQYLPGTNDCPNLQGAILCLEDTGEELSRFDRMFAHMKRMGVFEQICALVLGEFHDIQDSNRPFGFTLENIIAELTEGLNIPVLINAPFGHGHTLFPFMIGAQASLNTDEQLLNLQF